MGVGAVDALRDRPGPLKRQRQAERQRRAETRDAGDVAGEVPLGALGGGLDERRRDVAGALSQRVEQAERREVEGQHEDWQARDREQVAKRVGRERRDERPEPGEHEGAARRDAPDAAKRHRGQERVEGRLGSGERARGERAGGHLGREQPDAGQNQRHAARDSDRHERQAAAERTGGKEYRPGRGERKCAICCVGRRRGQACDERRCEQHPVTHEHERKRHRRQREVMPKGCREPDLGEHHRGQRDEQRHHRREAWLEPRADPEAEEERVEAEQPACGRLLAEAQPAREGDGEHDREDPEQAAPGPREARAHDEQARHAVFREEDLRA